MADVAFQRNTFQTDTFQAKIDWANSLSTAIGLKGSLVRKTTYGRPLTTEIGMAALLSQETSLGTWLCVASRDGGSIKTRDMTTWTVCAKDSAGRGTLPISFLAQYDNRLCGISYQNAGFAYSLVNDITVDWTDKDKFPNLPEHFTELFVSKDASDDPALYFLTPKGMYYLDVFTNFVFGPTEVNWERDDTSGKGGLYFKGDTYIAIGKGIYKITQGVVGLVGPDMDDGLPEDLQGTVVDMIGVGFWLVIAVNGVNKSCILKRYISGKHWHPVYVSNSSIRTLYWDSGTLYFGEGTNVKSLPFPAITDNINQLSTQNRASSGSLTYPYFHSPFEAMTKVAHKVWATTRDCTTDETITVYYRLNQNTNWATLGIFSSSPKPAPLSFGNAGVEFERIQLKIEMARGNTTTNSPKLEALILEYRVIPPTLWGWDFKVLAKTSGAVHGEDIINALKTALETGTLLSFYPGGDKSKTEYFVEIKGMPGNLAGTEFGTEGIYQVTVQEVV